MQPGHRSARGCGLYFGDAHRGCQPPHVFICAVPLRFKSVGAAGGAVQYRIQVTYGLHQISDVELAIGAIVL